MVNLLDDWKTLEKQEKDPAVLLGYLEEKSEELRLRYSNAEGLSDEWKTELVRFYDYFEQHNMDATAEERQKRWAERPPWLFQMAVSCASEALCDKINKFIKRQPAEELFYADLQTWIMLQRSEGERHIFLFPSKADALMGRHLHILAEQAISDREMRNTFVCTFCYARCHQGMIHLIDADEAQRVTGLSGIVFGPDRKEYSIDENFLENNYPMDQFGKFVSQTHVGQFYFDGKKG